MKEFIGRHGKDSRFDGVENDIGIVVGLEGEGVGMRGDAGMDGENGCMDSVVAHPEEDGVMDAEFRSGDGPSSTSLDLAVAVGVTVEDIVAKAFFFAGDAPIFDEFKQFEGLDVGKIVLVLLRRRIKWILVVLSTATRTRIAQTLLLSPTAPTRPIGPRILEPSRGPTRGGPHSHEFSFFLLKHRPATRTLL